MKTKNQKEEEVICSQRIAGLCSESRCFHFGLHISKVNHCGGDEEPFYRTESLCTETAQCRTLSFFRKQINEFGK